MITRQSLKSFLFCTFSSLSTFMEKLQFSVIYQSTIPILPQFCYYYHYMSSRLSEYLVFEHKKRVLSRCQVFIAFTADSCRRNPPQCLMLPSHGRLIALPVLPDERFTSRETTRKLFERFYPVKCPVVSVLVAQLLSRNLRNPGSL